MRPDDQKDAMSGRLQGEGESGRTARPGTGASTIRRVAFWVVLFVALYGLTLFVLSDDWFLLAMPGIVGMAVLGAMFSTAVLNLSPKGTVPYATDGTDQHGPVAFHRSVLVKRYALVLAVAVLLVAIFVLVKSDYLIPLAPLAVMTFAFGTYGWIGEMLVVSRCSRALKVYTFGFRAHVKVLNRTRNGGRALRLRGDDGQESPKLVARPLLGEKALSEGLSEGVWFAGDDLFGGVLLVPGSGKLAWVQPQDEPALQREQQSAAPERRGMAEQAGLGGNSK